MSKWDISVTFLALPIEMIYYGTHKLIFIEYINIFFAFEIYDYEA